MAVDDNRAAAAKRRGASEEEIRQLGAGEVYDQGSYEDAVRSLHTGHLWQEANRLIVPTPPPADETAWDWQQDDLRLTDKGINDLRAAIRAEKKLRREVVLMWVPAISALTGLAGAAIGLVVTWFGAGSPK
jgi:hypothetical protein